MLELGKSAEALRILGTALTSDPNDPDLLTQLAFAHRLAGNKSEAVAAAERAVAADPEYGWPYRALAWTHWDMGAQGAALQAARRSTELDPENAYGWSALAFFAGYMGRRREAKKAARKATALDPESPYVWSEVGAYGKGDAQLAAQRRALELAPDDAMLNNNYGYGLFTRGGFEESIPFFRKALALDPTNRLALGNLANALRGSGRMEEGSELKRRAHEMVLRETKEALEKDPHTVWALARRAWIHFQRGDQGAALQLLRRACERDQQNAEAWAYRFTVELAAGNIEEARRAAETLTRIEPDSPDGLSSLCINALVTDDLKSAQTAADLLGKRFPGSDDALAARATVLLLEGELKLAEEMFRKVLATDANGCCMLALRGVTLARSGDSERATECLASARQAHAVCPLAAFLEQELAAVKAS